MSTLKEKAEEILAEKVEKIIPENIRNGVTVFGVTGTYGPADEWTQINQAIYSDPENANNQVLITQFYNSTSGITKFSLVADMFDDGNRYAMVYFPSPEYDWYWDEELQDLIFEGTTGPIFSENTEIIYTDDDLTDFNLSSNIRTIWLEGA